MKNADCIFCHLGWKITNATFPGKNEKLQFLKPLSKDKNGFPRN